MDFGDDPLADLMSDGSNDSFFDDPKPKSKRGSLTKTPEKKLITDLFNISDKHQESSNKVPKKSDDWLGLDSKDSTFDPKKTTPRTPKLVKKISFDDDDDILGSLGMSKKSSGRAEHESPKPSKKTDLFQNILGVTKTEEVKKPTFEDILKESKAKSAIPPKSPLVSENLSTSESIPREGRRRRRSSGGLMDPLGLFSDDVKPAPKFAEREPPKRPASFEELDASPIRSKPVQSKSTPNISDQGLPDWLGGGSSIKQSKSENVLNQKSKPATPDLESESSKTAPTKITESIEPDEQHAATLNSILTQQKLAHSHMEYQNSAIALQQQESQLLMALQLKKYEENLSEMQQKQQDLLMKQEQQFNTLLERQFAKQQIMENNMRLQQERINNHIQMLISQPPVSKHSTSEEMGELKKTENEEHAKLYENIINSLKQRQHEEVFLLEESYKKQISLLEQTLESVEKRLRVDVEKISDVFEEKFKVTQAQHEEEISKYKQKIQEIESHHSEEIKQIRENNMRIIDEIKYEHSTLLENIKEVKKSESTLFNESSSYVQKLDNNIEILYSNSRSLQDLRTHIEKDYGILSKAREESLKAKEEEIVLMKATLEKCRESAEKERAELLALVRSLETKVAEQNQNAREERWAFQQAASTLAARSAALDRESEFNRASIQRERDQLKTLNESILAEQEKLLLQVTEEKLALSAEKSRLATSNKLVVNFDAQKAKAEMDAAIQIAREAAEMTDKERESLQREKCEIEKLKRLLLDQERKLNMRETELESLRRESERKIAEGENAISESKTIEDKYNQRLRELQNQLNVLSHREKKLAEEKISLSKERLALNTMMRQHKKCSICDADPQKLPGNNFDSTIEGITPYFSRFDNVDNDIMRLRREAIDDELDDNVPI